MLTPKEAIKLSRAIFAALVATKNAEVVKRSRRCSTREAEIARVEAANAQLKLGHMLIALTDHSDAPARVRKR